MHRNLILKAAIFIGLAFLITSEAARASPPPTIVPGSLKALDVCRFGGGWGIAWTQSGDNGTFYSTESADLPPELAAFAGKGGSFIFRVCIDVERNTHYFARIAGSKALPVCEVFEQEIFPDSTGKVGLPIVYGSTDGKEYVRVSGWTPKVPAAWQQRGYSQDDAIGPVVLAQLVKGACPPGNDPGYAHLTNVPPGMFKAMAQAFSRATSSLQGLAAVYRGPVYASPDPAVRLMGLPEMIQGSHFRSVTCTDRDCSAFLSNGNAVHFDVGDKGVAITEVLRWSD